MAIDLIDVSLALLDEAPVHVAGPRAFVLYQKQVGRAEIGTPLPDCGVWDSFSGDLQHTGGTRP